VPANSSSSGAEKPRRHPLWISAIAALIMIIGARLVRAYTPLGHNFVAEGFDLAALLVDLLIHFVIFFAVLIPLTMLWQRRLARSGR
jgi:uncharacterized membrane protein YhaH (DUF805 family)